jgi:hypothetical protein
MMAKEKASESQQAPCCPEDKHGPSYDNDVPVNSWLIGGGPGGAEDNPSFDHSKRNK